MKRLIGRSLVWTLLWCQAAVAQEVDFVKEVQPILESSCVHCHNEDRSEGELRLDSLEAALAGGENGPALVPG